MHDEWDYFSRLSGKVDVDSESRYALERLQEAHCLVNQGRHEEALDGYMWFFEHASEYGASVARTSVALRYWVSLARVFPKARAALEEIRDRKTRLILNGESDPFNLSNITSDFHDVVRINEQLGCQRATHEMFATLTSTDPARARKYAELAMPAVVGSRDFELAGKFLLPASKELLRLGESLNQCVEPLRSSDGRLPMERDILRVLVRRYVSGVVLLLEVLRGLGNTDEAEQIQSLAAEMVTSPEVRDAVWDALQSPDQIDR